MGSTGTAYVPWEVVRTDNNSNTGEKHYPELQDLPV